MIRAILAADKDWGIGKDGTMPWPHNTDDLKWFRDCTLDSTVIMGRKTWDSLPIQPLPNRKNAVVTRQIDVDIFTKSDIILDVDTITNHIDTLYPGTHKWIIGGAQLVTTLLPVIDEIWISRLDMVYSCDTFLPKYEIRKWYRRVSMLHDTLTLEKWVKIK